MTRNFSTKLIARDGSPMKRTAAEDSPDATIVDVVGDALLNVTEEEKGLSGADRNKRYKLWKKIDGGGEKSISTEEAQLIKDVVGKIFPPLIVGQVYDFIDEDPK